MILSSKNREIIHGIIFDFIESTGPVLLRWFTYLCRGVNLRQICEDER